MSCLNRLDSLSVIVPTKVTVIHTSSQSFYLNMAKHEDRCVNVSYPPCMTCITSAQIKNNPFWVNLIGYIRVYDRKWCINVKIMRYWLSPHPQLTPIVSSILRTELGPWHRPTAVPPGEQCLLCSPQDLLGHNCFTNVIVNFNRLWLRSQFLQHNDSNSSWEYWNGAAVWVCCHRDSIVDAGQDIRVFHLFSSRLEEHIWWRCSCLVYQYVLKG